MYIRYASKVSKARLQKFYKDRLYVPGRLFGMLYQDPQDYPEPEIVTASDDLGIKGVCIYLNDFKFGWRGTCDGLVGVYVKPEFRNQGIAEKLLIRMLERNDKVLGYTSSLSRVANKINSERLVGLS